ncbi:MAG: aminopeptidase N [Magnetococcus sp. DMHC-6]
MLHAIKRLAEYTQPPFLVDNIQLTFDLNPEFTLVHSQLTLRQNPALPPDPLSELRLDGRQLELIALTLNGQPLGPEAYILDSESLTLPHPPKILTLEITTRIKPHENTALEGVYQVNGGYCSQCEAEGFRKITYYPDRPDILARFTTTLIADHTQFPILLSNGNCIQTGSLANNRHFVTWEDPFPKPSYLFALVAGDLARIQDRFQTQSGRLVQLELFVEHENIDKGQFALDSLKQAMRWDEERFGREYDLDIYMIVAIQDFNMGAMENKGLNIFNSKYILANPKTATDSDYANIQSVVAHEYFHNWTGNRITCRDWFQLSLKEGLTVFRDQEFSGDFFSPALQRMKDVRQLRTQQFPEDAGPTAHPVQPDAYMEINNFYTSTVYNKGAELVRMMQTVLGYPGFRRGMDLYFTRHDGQAVTVDDLIRCMEEATSTDLKQFRLWYSQSGTPTLTIEWLYNSAQQTFELTIAQSCPPTPDQPSKKPFHIPVAVGLLAQDGSSIPLTLAESTLAYPSAPAELPPHTRLLQLRQEKETFYFKNIKEPPIPSILRHFSAPVKLQTPLTDDERIFLWKHDPDPFNRWEAGQELSTQIILQLALAFQKEPPRTLNADFIHAFGKTLQDPTLDLSLRVQTLTLPSEKFLLSRMDPADPLAIHQARQFVQKTLSEHLQQELMQTFLACSPSPGPFAFTPQQTGRRGLRHLCLELLLISKKDPIRKLALEQFYQANNMTDQLGALVPMVHTGCVEKEAMLATFFDLWHFDPLVMDKWFAIQATTPDPNCLQQVQKLYHHPNFNLRNPNKVYALIGAFCSNNPLCFHDPSGEGYLFLADQILLLNGLNPQVAARLLTNFGNWRKFEPIRKNLMQIQLEKIMHSHNLSRDVFEITKKCLDPAP